MELFVIHKISPYPSLLKRGIAGEELFPKSYSQNV
jgi:hypothetical protein